MLLNKADINLINRAVRHIQAMANQLSIQFGAHWSADANAKLAKRRFDVLLRDKRDLIALRKRLEKGE
jgi:hypothetical protein